MNKINYWNLLKDASIIASIIGFILLCIWLKSFELGNIIMAWMMITVFLALIITLANLAGFFKWLKKRYTKVSR